MANDDWRITIGADEGAKAVADNLGGELTSLEAQTVASDLKARRLSVSFDEDTVFVYAGTRADAQRAREIVLAELSSRGIDARTSKVEHWLEAEERWDDEPPTETWEQEELDEGYAPWEVRVQCGSRQEARDLAARLETEGYKPIRHSQFLIVGAASHEDAEKLATRLHGEVEVGGEVVLEAMGDVPRPFAIFGGLAQ
jgi:predicted RecB family endonuclease